MGKRMSLWMRWEKGNTVKRLLKVFRVKGKSLPPTTAASKFHSYRVYLQIYQWKILIAICRKNHGVGSSLIQDTPLTDLPPAPPELLKVFRCDCTTDCTSARCTCRKNGLKCTLACGHCQGTSCTNGSTVDVAEEDSDEADDQDWSFPQSKNWKSRIGVYGCQCLILSVDIEAQLK